MHVYVQLEEGAAVVILIGSNQQNAYTVLSNETVNISWHRTIFGNFHLLRQGQNGT